MHGLAVVTITWNDLDWLQKTLPSLRTHNPDIIHHYVVVNGCTDGTPEWLARQSFPYKIIHHPENLGVYDGTFSGWRAAVADGCRFILNHQSDFTCTRPIPFRPLMRYLDANPDVGFVRINDKQELPNHRYTREPIQYEPQEPLDGEYQIGKYNYHFSFNPYLFRASLVEQMDGAELLYPEVCRQFKAKHGGGKERPRCEMTLVRRYVDLGLKGAKIYPQCFDTYLVNRQVHREWKT